MEKIIKNSSAIIITILLVAFFVTLAQSAKQEVEKISLTQLATEINEEQVKNISVDGNSIEIELHNEEKQKTTKESDASLSETLTNLGVNEEKLNKVEINIESPSQASVWASALIPIFLPILLIVGLIWFMMKGAMKGNSQALSFGNSKARMIDPKDKKKRTTFKDVAGNKEAKEELGEVVDFLKAPKKFQKLGAKIPKGVLLLGKPGTGKTLMAKAVAGEAGVPFFTISGSEFVEMFVGVGASRVRDLFKQAKKKSPAIVFIDEIDAVGRQRGTGLGGGHDEREQTLNQILVEMDGFEDNVNVIVIAATNRPDVLDPALLRPGRFDRRVTVDLPDIQDRIKILKIHAKNKKIAQGVDLEQIAQRTPGFSGADLANLMNEGALLAGRENKKEVTMDDLIEAIEKVMLGPARKSRRLDKKEKKIIAYHEAGHAIVGASLKNANPIHKISIISRGSAGGYTLSVPETDKTLHSKAYFIDELAVFLGGYMTEKLVFDDVTTGPSNDLERATQVARDIVTRYGMSELGARTFGKKDEMVFLGRNSSEERDYSDKTAEDIDRVVSKFIDQAKQTANKIITEKREILDKIAETLLKKEVIEKDEFEAIMDGKEYVPKIDLTKQDKEIESTKKNIENKDESNINNRDEI
jgi:cell division protease FtsH